MPQTQKSKNLANNSNLFETTGAPQLNCCGRLHAFESMGLVDGPGIRSVYFLQGCPLRCAYCHNPDSQKINAGKIITVSDLLKQVQRYRPYYGELGGVTFSGGEPLLQCDFLIEAASALRAEGISVCLDSSGYGPLEKLPQLLPLIDCLLLDFKALTPSAFHELTERSMAPFQQFLDLVAKYYQGSIWVRHVMLPGFTDHYLAMERLLDLMAPVAPQIGLIEILPYHRLGLEKYQADGRPYRLPDLPAMDPKRAKQLEKFLRQAFAARYGRSVDQDELYVARRRARSC